MKQKELEEQVLYKLKQKKTLEGVLNDIDPLQADIGVITSNKLTFQRKNSKINHEEMSNPFNGMSSRKQCLGNGSTGPLDK